MNASEAAEIARIEESVAQFGAFYTSIALIIALPIAGVFMGFSMRRKKEGEKFRLLPLLICTGISIVLLAGQITRPPMGANSAPSVEVPETSEAEIHDMIVPAPSDARVLPTTASQAAELEAEFRREGEEFLTRSGHPSTNVTARVFDVSAEGLIVVRATVSTEQGIVSEQAEGVVYGQRMRIICSPMNPRTFAFQGSPCQQRMEEVFGSFEPVDRKPRNQG